MPEAGPAFRFQIRRRVEFSETDMAGIVHYSQFFRYMESAEHAFFRSLGMSIAPKGTGAVGWPRVHASCDFRRPLRFEDEFDVELLVRERGERSLKYLFRFWKDGAEIARGRLAVACIRRDQDGTMRSVAIPSDIAERISVAPEDLLGAEWTV